MGITKTAKNGSIIDYDRLQNIASTSYPPRPGVNRQFFLETQDEINDHFDWVMDFWRANCSPQKVYWLLNYTNFAVNPKFSDTYLERIRTIVDTTALTVVRYNGDIVQRSVVRFSAIKMHSQSHLYNSREEAMAVIRGLQKGDIQLTRLPL